MAAKTATKATTSLATMVAYGFESDCDFEAIEESSPINQSSARIRYILCAFFPLWVSLVSLVGFNDVGALSFGVDVPELES